MKEIEASRMNFLGCRKLVFTYKTMIFIVIGWCAFLFVLYKANQFRESSIGRKIDFAQKTLQEFTSQKDSQLKVIEAMGDQRRGKSAMEELAITLAQRPSWSEVLRKLTRSLPPQVWLDEVIVSPEKEGGWRMDIKGNTKSQQALTGFIMHLEAGGRFRRTELAGTKRQENDEGVFAFDISTRPVIRR